MSAKEYGLEVYTPSPGKNVTFVVALDAPETLALLSEVCVCVLVRACVCVYV